MEEHEEIWTMEFYKNLSVLLKIIFKCETQVISCSVRTAVWHVKRFVLPTSDSA